MAMKFFSSKSDDELIKNLEREASKGNTSAKEALAFFESGGKGDVLDEDTESEE